MDFKTFLSTHEKIWNSDKNLCFVGEQYPLLFFSKMFEYLADNKFLEKPTLISVDDVKLLDIESLLSQSFLGQKNVYFFVHYIIKWQLTKIKIIKKF